MNSLSNYLTNLFTNKKYIIYENIDNNEECKKIIETPSTTRTNSPDIENIEYSNESYSNYDNNNYFNLINENRKYTDEGIVFSNGELKWISGKPVYIVKTDYYYFDIQINIYYYLYENFHVKIGFYNNNEFIELSLV